MFTALMAFTLLLSLSSAQDYCKSEACPPELPNIACNNSGSLSPLCIVKNAKFVNLTTEKTKILEYHNGKRNLIAGGLIANFLPAVRMATMQWDSDLEYMASLIVKTCEFSTNCCVNTNEYRLTGQNVAQTDWYGYQPTLSSVIESQMDMWFDSYENINMSNINNVTFASTFTVMIHQLSTRIGCASVRYPELTSGRWWQSLTTVCTYSHTNVFGHKIYISGPVASNCTTGRNNNFENLCSLEEVYNVNDPL